MNIQSPYQTFKRYRTLQTHRVSALPIVILMPHSACNCRCVMCDIWKANQHLQQLTEADVSQLLIALKKFGTRLVLLSGGEALLNPNFFRLCAMIRKEKIKIHLLSTGLLLSKHAAALTKAVDEIIVSLDGDATTHDRIRNIPHAFDKMKEGIAAIHAIDPNFRVTGRSVIHRLNFRCWPGIIEAAKELGLQQVSFLPADLSSQAFNRDTPWDVDRQEEIRVDVSELEAMKKIVDEISIRYHEDFESQFIAESKQKFNAIFYYYAAFYGFNDFPYKKCNAPWVSTVIEADGTVRPCFFHEAYGNIKSGSLETIVNSEAAISFRKNLNMDSNDTCVKCVCYLNLSPSTKL